MNKMAIEDVVCKYTIGDTITAEFQIGGKKFMKVKYKFGIVYDVEFKKATVSVSQRTPDNIRYLLMVLEEKKSQK